MLHCGDGSADDTEGGPGPSGTTQGTTGPDDPTQGMTTDQEPTTGPTGGSGVVTTGDSSTGDESTGDSSTGDEPVVVCSPEPTGPAFYVDATLGLDSNDGLSPETPWQTMARVHTAQDEGALVPGVFVLFKRGESFAGPLEIKRSGAEGQPITFGSYDCGEKPIISGFHRAGEWTEVGAGVWSTDCAACGPGLNLVVVDGVMRGMGRYPNRDAPDEGFLSIDAHTGNQGDPDPWSLQDGDLALAPVADWTGAQAVIRKNYYVLDRCPIVQQQGNTLVYNQVSPASPTDRLGYFIQNHPATLDQLGEWYYEPNAKKLHMYFGAEGPAGHAVDLGAAGDVVTNNQQSDLTLETLSLQGANYHGINLHGGGKVTLREVDVLFSGEEGIQVESCNGVAIEGALVAYHGNMGINVHDSSDFSIINSTLHDTGVIPGLGKDSSGNYSGIGVTNFGNANGNILIEDNHVFDSGYMGIYFSSQEVLVKNNVVERFGSVKSDGGGIYSWGGLTHFNRKIADNIVSDGIGPYGGVDGVPPNGVSCIYLDDLSANIEVTGNSVTRCSRSGIFLHNSHEVTVAGNTVFDLPVQFEMSHQSNEPADPIRNISSSNNVFFAKHPTQRIIASDSLTDDFAQFNKLDAYDNNVYARPFHDDGMIVTAYQSMPNFYLSAFYGLSTWRAAFKVDANSQGSPVKLAPYLVNNQIGANLVANGAFNANADGLFCDSIPAGCAPAWTANGPITGAAGQITYDPMNGPNEFLRIYMALGNVSAGKSYVVRFAMQGADSERTVAARTIENGGDFGALSDTRFFTLGKSTSKAEILVTPNKSVKALLVLEMRAQQNVVSLDDIAMFEADVTIVDPDAHIRFEVNPTHEAIDIALDAKYIDAHGGSHEGAVALEPFTSIVLIKPQP